MPAATCTIEGCLNTNIAARGWCWKHWRRWRRHGDPEAVPQAVLVTPVVERLWRHIDVDPGTGCWNWTGSNVNGYGRIQVDGRGRSSHRVMYELRVGPIPEDHQIAHLCGSPGCCNPEHLEAVTRAEIVRRGKGHGTDTHCPQGHAYDEANTYRRGGRRYCRTCQRARKERQQATPTGPI